MNAIELYEKAVEVKNEKKRYTGRYSGITFRW